jgi:tRNA nucleotidyltransferase (CCA-adding enzyme)
MKEILKKALAEIKPSKEEEKEIFSKIDKVIKKIQKAMPETKVILGGSGEKGTWLKQAHDADIFVKFPFSYKDKTDELSNILQKKLAKVFRLERLHGSRDYFRVIVEDFTFEIVPIIEIKRASDAINITDISPLHASWVKKHKKFADEIRLTKQFLKAAKVYGAESYINGFSGYICEILTVYYKGFENLVKAASKWKPKLIIDIEKYHKPSEILFNIDKAKTQGPLVVVDPVQASRNAAAAVSLEKFNKLVEYSRAFLKKPSKDFFTIKGIDIAKLRKSAGKNDFFILEAVPIAGKEDIVGCKLIKVLEHISAGLRKNDFALSHSEWEWNEEDKAYFYLIIKKEILPEKRIIRGPPLKIKKGVEAFRKLHKYVYEEKGYLFAKEKRKYRAAKQLISDLVKDEYVREKVKKIGMN